MTIAEIEKKYIRIVDLIIGKQIKEAIDQLFLLIVDTQSGEFRNQLEKISDTYKNIIKYTIDGVQDPERQNIYNRMLVNILELADKVKETILTQKSGKQIYRMKQEFEKKIDYVKEEAVKAVSDLSFGHELDDVLKSTFVSKESSRSYDERDKMLTNFFNLIWLTDKFLEKDIKLVQSIRMSEQIPWYEKCIIVSALTLSVVRCFDPRKVELLFGFFEDGVEQVWHRALVGLVLALYIHDSRLSLYPEIEARLKIMMQKEGQAKRIEMIIIQLLRSKDTEKLTKKLQEDIIPEMMKIKPRLEDKLDLDNLMSADFMEDKNPDWEDFFKDTPDLYEKMEEFTNLQMEGSDVFWSAFAMLKQFDFFKVIHNWFLPFHKENQLMVDIFEDEKESIDPEIIMKGISNAAFLCNSDKYSFCFNIKFIPQAQKGLLMNFFNAEIESLNEMTTEDEILNKPSKDKFIYTQYIQDFYRFSKLHPLRNEFKDIFSMKLDIYNTWFFNIVIKDLAILRNVAEFYFEKNDFEFALELYSMINKRGDNSYEIYEKIGYCNQRVGKYETALEYYIKAELFDTNRTWLLKKIALCYRKLSENNKAIKYYKDALTIEPENIFILASIGHCYLALPDYENALKYFYKVEFLSPDSIKSARLVAWTSFIMGKFDIAHRLYSKIVNENPTKFDYINLGHVEWCLGNRMKAIENYKLSVRQENNNLDLFMLSFHDDRKYLIKHKIGEDEIPLMLDSLKYSLESAS